MFSNPKLIEFIVGSITILGGLVLLLHKLDLIRFGKAKKENSVDKLRKEYSISSNQITLAECSAHKDIAEKLAAVYLQQIKNNILHTQHLKKLEEGRREFKEVAKTLKIIGTNIAVLLDRSNREQRRKFDDLPLG